MTTVETPRNQLPVLAPQPAAEPESGRGDDPRRGGLRRWFVLAALMTLVWLAACGA